ncbi:hypothetical protein ACQKL5_19740 [Peribacillus sp. NPDC097675]|uniref:hypothetical protein n=1 Tax=Peribacillus sp. NPDC097675 TaxID=3390618 RepID=UPI003D00FCE7
MNKIIQELNLPGGPIRPVLVMRKPESSSIPVPNVEIQLQLDLLNELDSYPANKKE